MKIFIVAMSESIHTARWISQISDQGWEIHLFPSTDKGFTHQLLKNLKIYHTFYDKLKKNNKNVIVHGIPVNHKLISFLLRKGLSRLFPSFRLNQLVRLIKKIKPDIIHSLEIQRAGYLVMDAKKKITNNFPSWIVTNWGSDIYLFGKLPDHKNKIKEILKECDFYSCECDRDIYLAKDMGFEGEVLPVFPNTGGFDLSKVKKMRQEGNSSERRIIMLKGYQHWAGRALVGLRALERCADLLKGYEIVLYSTSKDVELAAIIFSQSTGIPVKILPNDTTHIEMLSWHGRARISIGLSISDAISTSLIEAIVMGSLPIQSCTACADEWINNMESGIIVHPEDVDVIEKAIRTGLINDELVNRASELNWKTANERLDSNLIKSKTIKLYNHYFNLKKTK